jgi:hypothetical protein
LKTIFATLRTETEFFITALDSVGASGWDFDFPFSRQAGFSILTRAGYKKGLSPFLLFPGRRAFQF